MSTYITPPNHPHNGLIPRFLGATYPLNTEVVSIFSKFKASHPDKFDCHKWEDMYHFLFNTTELYTFEILSILYRCGYMTRGPRFPITEVTLKNKRIKMRHPRAPKRPSLSKAPRLVVQSM